MSPERWGALPLDDRYYPPTPNRCTGCGEWCRDNYEHCDDCLVRVARAVTAVDRAVRGFQKAKGPTT